MEYKLLIKFKSKPILRSNWFYRFISKNQPLIQGLPFKSILDISNIGDEKFPRGMISNICIHQKFRGEGYSLDFCENKEIPELQSQKNCIIELGSKNVIPISGLLWFCLSIHSSDKIIVKTYQWDENNKKSEGSENNFWSYPIIFYQQEYFINRLLLIATLILLLVSLIQLIKMLV